MIEEYFELQKKIYDHFGYVEDWVVIPMDDARGYYWYYKDGDDEVHFAENRENLKKIVAAGFDYNAEGCNSDDYYTHEIYTQRFLPKWVYEADDMTMICVDTRTDGNKFLQIFDNAKRVTV